VSQWQQRCGLSLSVLQQLVVVIIIITIIIKVIYKVQDYKQECGFLVQFLRL